jgi:thioredoxin-dependent peroxiredoxin
MKTFRCLLCWTFAVAFVAAAASADALPLKIGDTAPLVSGVDQDGNKWKLKEDIGKEVVLLYFYPKDDTRGCTAEACGLRDSMVDFKQQGVAVVGVSFDSADSHKSFVFKYNLNFPLIVDSSGEIADAYQARMDGDKKMDRRISFLIGLDGKIAHITDSPDPAVHLREMKAAIARLGGKTSP